MEARFIIDRAESGVRNMAADEALLIDAAERGTATLRFYFWDEPTLSLGYFQSYEDRTQHAASAACAVVRRQTGGGAILHEHELTYSLALPQLHPFARQNEQLYAHVHNAFIAASNELLSPATAGWQFSLRGIGQPPRTRPEPFLCFQRQSPGDVILVHNVAAPDVAFTGRENPHPEAWKVLGSAQRRYHGAVLQHGSLLLQRSPAAPELPGIRDVLGRIVAVEQLVAALRVRLATALGLRFHEMRFPAELEANASEIANTKYRTPGWLKRH